MCVVSRLIPLSFRSYCVSNYKLYVNKKTECSREKFRYFCARARIFVYVFVSLSPSINLRCDFCTVSILFEMFFHYFAISFMLRVRHFHHICFIAIFFVRSALIFYKRLSIKHDWIELRFDGCESPNVQVEQQQKKITHHIKNKSANCEQNTI